MCQERCCNRRLGMVATMGSHYLLFFLFSSEEKDMEDNVSEPISNHSLSLVCWWLLQVHGEVETGMIGKARIMNQFPSISTSSD